MRKKIKVAFQGEKGAYSHLACLEIFPQVEAVPCSTFEEAFQLAKEHDEMKVYSDALQDNGTQVEYSAIARFYESKNEQGKAGQFYSKCGQYMKALNLYLDCGEREMDRSYTLGVYDAKAKRFVTSETAGVMIFGDAAPKV